MAQQSASGMSHKERVSAVLHGQPVDRPPVSTWGHDFLREWSAAELAAHTIERQQKYNYDFVKLNPRWTLFAEPWGNTYEPPQTQKFPRLLQQMVNSPADLTRLPKVEADHPLWQEHLQALDMVLTGLDGEVDVVATLFSPLAVLGLLCGGVGEPVNSYARSHTLEVHEALTHITETLSAHTRQLIDTGAAGIFFAALQWTSLDVCDEDFYNEFGRPYDLQVLQAAADAPMNMLHVCGNNTALQRFFDYPTQIFNWDNFGPGNLSLAEASAMTDKVVAGGIPHRRLHKLQAGELQQITQQVLDGVTGKVMLAGGCGIGASVEDSIRCEVTEVADALAG